MLAGDVDAAELRGDGGEHLDIEEEEALAAEVLVEVVEGDFGGVADAVEHGFAREKSADGDAVDAADEPAVLPAFEAVCVALGVHLGVAVEEFLSDPGGAAARGGFSAAFHDFAKRAVAGDLENIFANGLDEAAGEMELVELENAAGIGRPPGDGIGGPRENTAAIGEEEARDGEIAADRDEAFGVGKAGVREAEGVVEDVNGERHGTVRSDA